MKIDELMLLDLVTRRKLILESAKESGWSYNSETGVVTNRRNKPTSVNSRGYHRGSVMLFGNKFAFTAHQFAWFYTHGCVSEYIDHINGNKEDNRIINLRAITLQENQWNRHKSKSYHFRNDKYESRIRVNGRGIYLGRYDTEQEALDAYDEAKIKYHNIDNSILNEESPKIKEKKGYYLVKNRNVYQSVIVINKKRIFLGRFHSEDEAHQAYLDAKIIYNK